MKILMVCLGNICRSPLAEGILRRKIEERGLDWDVDSAGTGSWHIGEPPDRRSVKVAQERGLDITAQRARQINPLDIGQYDLILTMDRSNYRDVLRLAAKDQQGKVRMIMEYLHPEEAVEVPDPYFGDQGFDKVFDMLEAACEGVIQHHYEETPR